MPRPADAADPALRSRFDRFVDQYRASLRRAVEKLCPRHLGIDADDIEQEALLRVWRALEQEREITHPTSYLWRAVSSATVDAVRRVQARREEALEQSVADDAAGRPAAAEEALAEHEGLGGSPERRAAQGQIFAAVERFLSDQEPQRRRAIGLHLQGFTTEEIGALLGWTEAKARNLVYRALADLRRVLTEKGLSV